MVSLPPPGETSECDPLGNCGVLMKSLVKFAVKGDLISIQILDKWALMSVHMHNSAQEHEKIRIIFVIKGITRNMTQREWQ